jgi:hypothetical protein
MNTRHGGTPGQPVARPRAVSGCVSGYLVQSKYLSVNAFGKKTALAHQDFKQCSLF